MKLVVLMFTLSAIATSASAAPDSPSFRRELAKECQPVVTPVSAKKADKPQERGLSGKPLMLSAVDHRVNNCSMLRIAGTGELIEAPQFVDGPARRSPARAERLAIVQ